LAVCTIAMSVEPPEGDWTFEVAPVV
jgi:hypothetical protein